MAVPSIFIKSAQISSAALCMEATASSVRRGEVGTRAQLALMEFPLFPVFLRAAVQTPPVPRGWAGSGKSACLPIIHLAALEREQSTQTYGEWCPHGEKSDKSLFVQHFFTFFLVFLRQKQIHAGVFTNGRPI